MRTLLLAALAAVSANATASSVDRLQGRVLVIADAQNLYELYPDTVKERGGFPTAWFLQEHRQPLKTGELSAKMLVAANCQEELFAIKTLSGFSGQTASGTVVRTENATTLDWRPVVPGSSSEDVYGVICALSHGTAEEKAKYLEGVGYTDEGTENYLNQLEANSSK